MKDTSQKPFNEISLTDSEFLNSYNGNMPEGYQEVTMSILKKFKVENPSLFKLDGLWTLDRHRKHMIDWLPRNYKLNSLF